MRHLTDLFTVQFVPLVFSCIQVIGLKFWFLGVKMFWPEYLLVDMVNSIFHHNRHRMFGGPTMREANG